MPCDSIITNSVEFAIMAKNPALLGLAVAAEFKTQLRSTPDGYQCQIDGYTVTFGRDGKASVRGTSQRWLGLNLDRLKQAYSREAVKEAARRAGFSVKQQGDNLNMMTAERRTA